MPRPENYTPHEISPDTGGGFTDPTPAQDGIIVQGGRTAHGSDDSAQAIGPKQDDPRAIGPKQDDPRAIGPKQDDPRAIGPKQDDPRAIGPKQDDPRALGHGIIVQGGRTEHPDKKARQKRAKKKMKTMMLVIGGVMVVAVGGAVAGRQLGQDPATTLPHAATPAASASAGASGTAAPSASSDSTSQAPAAGESAPATETASPTPVASDPPARTGTGTGTGTGSGSSASPVRPTRSAQPTQSSTAAPVAAPELSLSPTSVQEYCANGEWPNTLVIRNSGGGTLNWTVGQLPPGVTASVGAGALGADATEVLRLGGRTEQQPADGRFTVSFSSNGGSGQVTVACA
ncbi:hypothetical protein [Streptomyces sp. NPDC003943]